MNSKHKEPGEKERSSEPVIMSGRNYNDGALNSNRSQKFVNNVKQNARERPDINKMSVQDLKKRMGRLNDEHVVSVYNENRKAIPVSRPEQMTSQGLDLSPTPYLGDPVLHKNKKKMAEATSWKSEREADLSKSMSVYLVK